MGIGGRRFVVGVPCPSAQREDNVRHNTTGPKCAVTSYRIITSSPCSDNQKDQFELQSLKETGGRGLCAEPVESQTGDAPRSCWKGAEAISEANASLLIHKFRPTHQARDRRNYSKRKAWDMCMWAGGSHNRYLVGAQPGVSPKSSLIRPLVAQSRISSK